MNHNNYFKTAVTYVFLFFCTSLHAGQPTVNGNKISWPNDGWYQVQNASNYKSVCQGGRSCIVGNGKYIVINHSKKDQRYDVTVPSAPANNSPSTPTNGSPIIVRGNEISWPNDGWYQVQNAANYKNICSGTRSCIVEPGIYNVINHTTNTPYRGIRVVANSGGSRGGSSSELSQNDALLYGRVRSCKHIGNGQYEHKVITYRPSELSSSTPRVEKGNMTMAIGIHDNSNCHSAIDYTFVEFKANYLFYSENPINISGRTSYRIDLDFHRATEVSVERAKRANIINNYPGLKNGVIRGLIHRSNSGNKYYMGDLNTREIDLGNPMTSSFPGNPFPQPFHF